MRHAIAVMVSEYRSRDKRASDRSSDIEGFARLSRQRTPYRRLHTQQGRRVFKADPFRRASQRSQEVCGTQDDDLKSPLTPQESLDHYSLNRVSIFTRPVAAHTVASSTPEIILILRLSSFKCFMSLAWTTAIASYSPVV